MEPASAEGTRLKQDFRQVRRYSAELPLKVTREGLAGPMSVTGRCTDMAEAGLGAELSSPLIIGEIVRLTFALPHVAELFELKARVLYRNGDHYGFYFLNISEWQRMAFERGCELMSG
jgi:PilZ domain